MSPMVSFLLIFSCMITILSIARAQDRAHGVAYESPMAFSPSAYHFFHPNTQDSDTKDHCSPSNCSSLPVAAEPRVTEAAQENESSASNSQQGRSRVAAGVTAGIASGFAFAVLGFA
ncbi:uncharacterized protein LOC121240261 [Juglans microcarpa x Juglans regia]|uniref:uncharacterized protein LOC121240261 n=1 Tax=Juglans microcarpa x Juglans regia TaxID=2249226 RepID=UPI001B7DC8A6|nr:uncharacterized protein LOC121240261 [Juglans microcarpa x Juglans regia]